MGRLYVIQLDGRVFSCKYCRSHLSQCDELVSKSFHCRHRKAYLVNTVVDVSLRPQEDRLMTTGKHTVADICCSSCQQVVGWKYESAFEKSQKYNQGKFILERGWATIFKAKIIDGDGASFYLDAHGSGHRCRQRVMHFRP